MATAGALLQSIVDSSHILLVSEGVPWLLPSEEAAPQTQYLLHGKYVQAFPRLAGNVSIRRSDAYGFSVLRAFENRRGSM